MPESTGAGLLSMLEQGGVLGRLIAAQPQSAALDTVREGSCRRPRRRLRLPALAPPPLRLLPPPPTLLPPPPPPPPLLRCVCVCVCVCVCLSRVCVWPCVCVRVWSSRLGPRRAMAVFFFPLPIMSAARSRQLVSESYGDSETSTQPIALAWLRVGKFDRWTLACDLGPRLKTLVP